MLTISKRIIGVGIVLVFAITGLSAQSGTSRLGGTISDANGAPIAGAKIVATNESTGVSQTQVSSSSGSYTFASLAAGK